MRTWGLGAAILLSSLLACSAAPTLEEPSQRCVELMAEAAAAPIIVDQEVPELVESLTACETADLWLAALRTEPAAMAHADASTVSDFDLAIVCDQHTDTPVCTDAADRIAAAWDDFGSS